MQKAIKKIFSGICIADADCIHDRFPCTIRVRCIPFVLQVYNGNRCRFIGLGNYAKILGDGDFLHSLWFTALFTIVTVLLINIFAFAVAMLLTKSIKGTNIFRTVFFMPNLIGGIVLGYVWQLLLNGILAHFQKTLTYSSKYGFGD